MSKIRPLDTLMTHPIVSTITHVVYARSPRAPDREGHWYRVTGPEEREWMSIGFQDALQTAGIRYGVAIDIHLSADDQERAAIKSRLEKTRPKKMAIDGTLNPMYDRITGDMFKG